MAGTILPAMSLWGALALAACALAAERPKTAAAPAAQGLRMETATETNFLIPLGTLRWRVASPIGFELWGGDPKTPPFRWKRGPVVKGVPLEVIEFGRAFEVSVDWDGKCGGATLVPLREGEHFGKRSRSRACGVDSFFSSRESLSAPGVVEDYLLIFQEAAYHGLVMQHFCRGDWRRWQAASESGRDKLCPGRDSFRKMQASLSPIEPEPRAPERPPLDAGPEPEKAVAPEAPVPLLR